MAEKLLHIGRIGKPHGINGQVTADWFGETEPSRGDTVFLQTGSDIPVAYTVDAVTQHKGRLIFSLNQVNDRNAAAALVGKAILLSRNAVKQPDDDEAFLADLPGCAILMEDGTPIGVLDHLEFPAGQPVWAINGMAGNEILLPGQPEFIKKINLAQKEITIAPPEGLLDIYSA